MATGRVNVGGGTKINFQFYNGIDSISNPLLNGIKIDEAIPVEQIYFQRDEPQDPTLNDLWLRIGNVAVDVNIEHGLTGIDLALKQSGVKGSLLLIEENASKVYGDYLTLRRWDGGSWEYLDAYYWNGDSWVQFSISLPNFYWSQGNNFAKVDYNLNVIWENLGGGLGSRGIGHPPIGDFLFGLNATHINKINKITGEFTSVPIPKGSEGICISANNDKVVVGVAGYNIYVLDHDLNLLQTLNATGNTQNTFSFEQVVIDKDGYIASNAYGSHFSLFNPDGVRTHYWNGDSATLNKVLLDENRDLHTIWGGSVRKYRPNEVGGFTQLFSTAGTGYTSTSTRMSFAIDKAHLILGEGSNLSSNIRVYDVLNYTYLNNISMLAARDEAYGMHIDILGNLYVGLNESSKGGMTKYDKDGNYIGKVAFSSKISTPFVVAEPGNYSVAHEYY